MSGAGGRMTRGQAVLAAVYFLLATGMYYFNKQSAHLGIDLLYKVIFAIVIALLSIVIFLVKTDLPRAKKLWKYLCLLVLPHFVVLIASMPVWVFNLSSMEMVRRGAFAQIYCIAIVLAGAGFLYVFGEKGLWINLGAMLASNLLTIFSVIQGHGFGEYWNELKNLILSFGGDTGTLMQSVEIHELTFALGLYLLYMILNWREARKKKLFWVLFILACFCYLSGFKRIGAFAIVFCVLVKLILTLLTREKRKGWLMAVTMIAIGVAFGYICFVRGGGFDFLENEFQVNTMGRRDLYAFIEDYYTIGPDYFGQGAGFVSRLFSDLPGRYVVRALHNDVLGLYIDIGFWGFWIWMLAFFPMRVWYVTKWQGVRGGILSACYCLFVIITAMTDNTIYYIYVAGATAILTMGYRFDEAELGEELAGAP